MKQLIISLIAMIIPPIIVMQFGQTSWETVLFQLVATVFILAWQIESYKNN